MVLHLPTFLAEAFPGGLHGLTDAAFKAALAARGLGLGKATRREERADGVWLVGLVAVSKHQQAEPAGG